MSKPLANERYERIAQEIAKGAGDFEAYRIAGYKGGRPAASAIANRPEVRARVTELLQRAATRTELTVASITERLVGIADKAEAVALGAAGLSVARAALMDAAKLNGLVVDTIERIQRSPEERRARIAQLKAERDAATARLH